MNNSATNMVNVTSSFVLGASFYTEKDVIKHKQDIVKVTLCYVKCSNKGSFKDLPQEYHVVLYCRCY